MKIKLMLIYVFISLSQVGCSQQSNVILKKCFSESTKSFKSKNYICQKLIFKEQNLICKINYSSNGWQIIDSVSYQNEGGKYCVKSYQPLYDVENKSVKNYELLNINCNQVKESSYDNLLQIKDKYDLSSVYIDNIEFLLSKNPEKSVKGFIFKNGIIPSLFVQYGIPYDELLNALTFNIKNKLLKDDSFVYKNFVLTRNYEYDNGLLKEVRIEVRDRKERIISQFREVFELE